MHAYVVDQITEYLGESEETLVGFVLDKVSQRTTKESLLSELDPILDEDAGTFVSDLWSKLAMIVSA